MIFSLLVSLLATAASSHAAADSVAVFHRPDKVVVQVNEAGAVSRLQTMLDAFGADKELLWKSPEGGLYLNCGRNERAATCIFRFTPSKQVGIRAKEALFVLPTGSPAQDFHVIFEGSRGDRFRFVSQAGQIVAHARRP